MSILSEPFAKLHKITRFMLFFVYKSDYVTAICGKISVLRLF